MSTSKVLTIKDEAGLDIARHTLAAQVLARAVKDLYPDALLAIGPTIQNGFYYDVDFKEPIVPEALPEIDARMREILKEDLEVTREMWPRDKAIQYFLDKGELIKLILSIVRRKIRWRSLSTVKVIMAKISLWISVVAHIRQQPIVVS